mmetsp:Transcript_13831/g.35842  ORF Transcript_13831/g.35842 Transcript_13831/m.35842 type:complete len:197 (+) Transcript_13831:61-651(+)
MSSYRGPCLSARCRSKVTFAALLAASWLACAAAADIHEAVRSDSAEAVEAALSSGEDLNKIGPGGQTPLMHGVLQGMAKAVAVLLEKRADTTIAEKDGYTPMHGAGFQGRADIMKLLIAHGLNPSDMHTDGYTPLHRSCWGGEPRHTETVKVLLEAGVSPDEPSKDGKLPVDMVRGNRKTRKLLKKRLKQKKEEEL